MQNYHFKFINKILIILCLIINSLSIQAIAAENSEVIALVNGYPITKYQLDQQLKIITDIFHVEASAGSQSRQLRLNTLNALVEREILKQYAKKIDRKVPEDEIALKIKSLEQGNNMPAGGLKQYIKSLNINFNSFEDFLVGERIKEMILGNLGSNIDITGDEIERALVYNSSKDYDYKAIIFTSNDTSPRNKTKMLRLRQRLKACDDIYPGIYNKYATTEEISGRLKTASPKIQSLLLDTRVLNSSNLYIEDDKYKILHICMKEPIALENKEEQQLRYFIKNRHLSKKAEKLFVELKKQSFIQLFEDKL